MSVELVAAERELEEAARSFPKQDEPKAETLRRLQQAAIAYAKALAPRPKYRAEGLYNAAYEAADDYIAAFWGAK